MYCKVACQIFYSTFAQKKKKYPHFPEHSICQILPKNHEPQKIITKTNNTQLSIQMTLLNMYISPTKYVYI